MTDIIDDLTKSALGGVDEHTKALALEFTTFISMINARTIALLLSGMDENTKPTDYIDAIKESWVEFKANGLEEEYKDLSEKLESSDPMLKMVLGVGGIKEACLDELRQEVEEKLEVFNERVFATLYEKLD